MSEVITDKLTGRATAGDVTITSEGGSATMQLQQGVEKAWAYLSTNAYTVSNSLNIASSIDNGTARPEVNFTNVFDNNYIVASGSAYNRIVGYYDTDGGITTSSYAHALIASSEAFEDSVKLGLKYSGDLA